MSEPLPWAALSIVALVALLVITGAALAAWREWIGLQRLAMERAAAPCPTGSAGSRIELADLRERIRKLEAIAAGVDL